MKADPNSNRSKRKVAEIANVIAKSVDPKKSACGFNCQRILQIAKSQGSFHVCRYSWSKSALRQKLWGMKEAGMLTGGRNQGGVLVYYAAPSQEFPVKEAD